MRELPVQPRAESAGKPFSAEVQLILLTARGNFSEEMREQARGLLQHQLDWPLILRLVRLEGVYPLVCRNLRDLGFSGMPADARAELEAYFRRNVLRSALLVRELTRLLKLLRDGGVPVIPLKGPALSQFLYGDPTLRLCSDMDVLVPRKLVRTAHSVFRSTGYRALFDDRYFFDLLMRSDVEYLMTREERGFLYLLEPHWGIMHRLSRESAAMDDLWKEARPEDVFGIPACRLSPEWELLALTTHISRHGWQGLKWLVDIHDLCASGRVDWERAERKANDLRLGHLLRLTASACRKLFDTPIPEHLSFESLPRWVRLFPAQPSRAGSFEVAVFPLRLCDRSLDKLRYLVRTLFTPTLADHRFIRLPASAALLYYPLRPLRLGCKWGWKLLSRKVRFRRRNSASEATTRLPRRFHS